MRGRRKPWWLLGVVCLLMIVVKLGRTYARSDFGRDHLCGAAYRGNLAEMWPLLEAGADPSRVGWDDHFTPLGSTVRTGQVKAACLLLARGADPNIRMDFGPTPVGLGANGWEGKREDQEKVIALIRAKRGR